MIENEADVAALAADVGFDVRVICPDRTTELCKIYRELNASDAMVGVHGAAMTHFLFMRPGKVFIQVVPLSTDWAASAYYGEPAARLGLREVGYKIAPEESSLSREPAHGRGEQLPHVREQRLKPRPATGCSLPARSPARALLQCRAATVPSPRSVVRY